MSFLTHGLHHLWQIVCGLSFHSAAFERGERGGASFGPAATDGSKFPLSRWSHDVTLASLRIKLPVRTREGYRIAERASRAFLSARIRETYRRKRELNLKVNSIQGRLGTELSTADYQKVMSLSY